MSSTSAVIPSSRTWRVPRPPLEDWIFITLCTWAGLIAAMIGMGIGIDQWQAINEFFGREVGEAHVTTSIWGIIASIGVWYLGFVSGYFLHEIFPAFVANGRTRRDSAIEAGIFSGLLVLITAALLTLGFIIERMVYAIGGWQRGSPSDQLYSSYNDYGWILIATFLQVAMWAAGGALVGSSFYRSRERGFVVVLVALGALAITGSGNGGAGPFNDVMHEIALEPTRWTSVVLMLLCTAVLAGVTWWNVRSLALRNK